MSVDPATAKHSHVQAGVTRYFCAQNCLEQFKTDPEKFMPHDQITGQPRRRLPIGREILIAAAIFAGVALLLIMIRGIAKKDVGQTTRTSVAGSSAGQHEAVDDGSGGVIASAKHERDGTFVVSLNTHTVDLQSFDPAQQIKLHVGSKEETPATVAVDGEKSSHHQNYRVFFADPGQSEATLSVHNLGGVGERKLPFNL